MGKTKTGTVYFRQGEFNEYEQYCDGSSFTSPTTQPNKSVLSYGVTFGDNYPDWRYRLANGLQCTTVASGTKWTVHDSPWALRTYLKPKVQMQCISSFPFYVMTEKFQCVNISTVGPIGDSSITEADNQAKAHFVQKLRDTQTTFQGGVVAGELGETLRMLVSPAKSLRKGLSSYLATLKKRKRQVKRVSPRKRLSTARRVIADTWLEYSFGWKPLLHDIDDAAKLLAERHMSRPKWQTVTAIGVDTLATFNEQGIGSTPFYEVVGHFSRTDENKVVYKGCVDTDSVTSVPWNQSGFSLDNFLPTVWELIPYSFLVDYFTNIDDIISAATFRMSSVRWMSKTTINTKKTIVSSHRLVVPSSSTYFVQPSVTPGTSSKQLETFSRAPYNGSLVPTLHFTVPGFGTKWINMAALLVGNRALVPFHR